MLNRMASWLSSPPTAPMRMRPTVPSSRRRSTQLKSEIDRIADSANFNGIKLLDGSLSSTGGSAADQYQFGWRYYIYNRRCYCMEKSGKSQRNRCTR